MVAVSASSNAIDMRAVAREAAEQRQATTNNANSAMSTRRVADGSHEYNPHDNDWTERLRIRRLIRPIIEFNSRTDALDIMTCLLKISENIIEDPEEPKFRRLKANGESLKKKVLGSKGTAKDVFLEMGFRGPKNDENWEPCWYFNPKQFDHLKVVAKILDEQFKEQLTIEEKEEWKTRTEKRRKEAHELKIRMNIRDDRIRVQGRTELEKQKQNRREDNDPNMNEVPPKDSEPRNPPQIRKGKPLGTQWVKAPLGGPPAALGTGDAEKKPGDDDTEEIETGMEELKVEDGTAD